MGVSANVRWWETSKLSRLSSAGASGCTRCRAGVRGPSVPEASVAVVVVGSHPRSGRARCDRNTVTSRAL